MFTFNHTELLRLMQEQNLNQEQLARKVDVSLKTVWNWKEGRSQPKGAQLLKLALALGVRPESLYSREEEIA